jgi:hypothetical protein
LSKRGKRGSAMVRLAACGVFAIAALLVGLTATAADASSGVITVLSASSPASSVGSLSIELESTTPVVPSSISAQLSASGTNVVTVSDFDLTGGSNTGGTVTTWTVATPITVAQLPLGTYTIGVSASDTGGDTASVSDAGTLAYLIQPTITLAASPSTVSYGQTLTFSGTVTGLFPDGSEQPLAGQPVTISANAPAATTDSSGNFSVSVQAGPTTIYDATSFDAGIDTATVANGFSNSADITIAPDPVQLTAQLSSNAVSYGTAVTLSGQISFESGTTWLPFTGATIGVFNNYFGPFPNYIDPYYAIDDSLVADNSGDFTVSLPVTGPEQLQAFYAPPTDASAWFDLPAAVNLPLSVVLPDGLSQVTASLTPAGGVSLSACLDVDTPAGASYVNPVSVIPDVPDVQFQYAGSPAGPWKTLISAAPTAAGANSNGTAECYSGQAKAPGTSEYYRAETDGSVNFQPATSSAVHASIDPTRFGSFTVAPSRPKAGRPVTVAGLLQQHASNWRSLARQKVQVIFRAKGSKTWTVLRTLTTRASGRFSAVIRLRHSGLLSARYLGDKTDLQCSARQIRIDIRK